MKYVIHILFLIVFSIIQPTWLEYIEIFNIKPNLFLVYIVIISSLYPKKEGAIVGFFFGLMLDLLIGGAIGLNAVLFLLLSMGISDFCDKYIRNSTLLTTAIIVFVSALVYEFVYYIIAFMGDLDLINALLKVVLPEGVYCTLTAVLFYFIIPKREKSELL